jgi:urease gamma subunit
MFINFIADHADAKHSISTSEDKKSLLQLLTSFTLKPRQSLFKSCFICLSSLASSRDIRMALFKLNFYSECVATLQKYVANSKKDNERIAQVLQFLAQISLHEDGQLLVFKLTGKLSF